MPETKPRLLVVDDEEPLMIELTTTLRNHGYDTTGFTSASAALAELDRSSYELVLADLTMPEMDGIELLRLALTKDPQLVGIIVTDAETIHGAFDHILKPFKRSAVLPVVERALAMRHLRCEILELETRVRQRDAELEALSFSISHDLKAPLRAVTMFSEILTRRHASELSEEARRLLQFVAQGAQEMNRLIEDLLQFSRVSRQPLSSLPVDMHELARQVLLPLVQEHSGRTIDLHVEELPPAIGDESLLRQLFINLLSNAFKFTRKREIAKIEVGSLSKEGERIYFVRDNGAGFDMQYAKDLFGVFRRMHTQDEFEGTGIGLAIVRQIIQRHGGRVWADARVDQGATIYFTLEPR